MSIEASFSIKGTGGSRKQLLRAVAGESRWVREDNCDFDTSILFPAFCESDAAVLFLEDVTSSCLYNVARTADLTRAQSFTRDTILRHFHSRFSLRHGWKNCSCAIRTHIAMLNSDSDKHLHFRYLLSYISSHPLLNCSQADRWICHANCFSFRS